jgi:hypothetical protein
MSHDIQRAEPDAADMTDKRKKAILAFARARR